MKLFELEAVLSLDTNNFVTGVAGATSEGKTLAEKLGADADSIKSAFEGAFSISIGQLMADGVQAAMQQLVEFTSESIKAASDLEQTNSKIEAIYGGMSAAVMAWSATTKSEFGIGQLAAKTYAAQLAGILSTDAYGFDASQIYEYSTAMVELAGDLASFHNMDVDTIWTKLLSGLRGETEAIEDLGLDMRVASLAAFAGIAEQDFSKLPTAEQWLYRYQYILQNTTVAQGDFARTSDSYANQMALFQQNIADLKATLGEGLLPVMTDLLSFMNSLFGGTKDADEVMGDIQTTLTGTYAQIDTTAQSALNLIAALEAMEEQGVDTAEEQSVWDALLADLSATMPGIDSLINTTTGYISGGTAALRNYASQWQETQRELAVAAALQEAQNEIFAQAKEVAQIEMDLAVARARAGSSETEIARLYEEARQYLGLSEDAGTGHITGELASAAAGGDAMAQYYAEQLSLYDDLQTTIATLETDYAAAQAELAALQAQYTAMESRVDALIAGADGASAPVVTPTNTGPVSQAFAESIAAAVTAAIGDVHITVEGEVDMDGQKVGNLVLPTVALGLRRQSLMSTYSGKK